MQSSQKYCNFYKFYYDYNENCGSVTVIFQVVYLMKSNSNSSCTSVSSKSYLSAFSPLHYSKILFMDFVLIQKEVLK